MQGAEALTLSAGAGSSASPLPDHSIKAGRYTSEYLTGRLLAGSLRKLISSPATPDASAGAIAPGAPCLRFRDTSIIACLVAVGAFHQAGRKPMSLPFGKCRVLSTRERRRRHNRKHRQSHQHFVNVQLAVHHSIIPPSKMPSRFADPAGRDNVKSKLADISNAANLMRQAPSCANPNSGKHLLAASISPFDPKRSLYLISF
jgi:hypothetical protein